MPTPKQDTANSPRATEPEAADVHATRLLQRQISCGDASASSMQRGEATQTGRDAISGENFQTYNTAEAILAQPPEPDTLPDPWALTITARRPRAGQPPRGEGHQPDLWLSYERHNRDQWLSSERRERDH